MEISNEHEGRHGSGDRCAPVRGTQLARAAGNKNADKSQCLLYAPSPDASVAVR